MINSKIKTGQQRFENVVPITIILVTALIILYFFSQASENCQYCP